MTSSKKIWHRGLVNGGWSKFSFAEQMGNIGSEIGHAIKWSKKGKGEQKEKALARGFELMSLTCADER